MKPIRHLEELIQIVKGEKNHRLSVAAGQDPDTILAVSKAVKEKIIDAVLVGDQATIEKVAKQNKADLSNIDIIHRGEALEATEEALRLVRSGEASILMKGLITTATYMSLILDKEKGLLPKDGLLSHAGVIELPAYPKLLIVADAAIIPTPNLENKIQILKYCTRVANALGNKMPKAALVSATESISFKVQSSVDAAVITAMAQRKQITGVIVDGPLALDVSLSPRICKLKGLESLINGESDILVFPNIETANTFYKTSTLLAHAKVASIVCGTSAPVILTSRGDSDNSKLYSIALAARLAAQ